MRKGCEVKSVEVRLDKESKACGWHTFKKTTIGGGKAYVPN
jgi:hypothetical protein